MKNRAYGVVVCLVLAGGTAWAGRPLAVDDADPVGQFEFEAGVGYVHDSNCDHLDVPFGLTCGLLPNVEIGIGFGGQFEERTEVLDETGTECKVNGHGIGDLTVGAKWQFLGESTWLPRQAIVPSVKLPTADDDKGLGSGETDYNLTWVASKSLGEKMGAHINVGCSWIGEPKGEDVGDVVRWGLALDYQITNPLQWVGEVFAEKELQDGTDTVVQFNIGFRWNPTESLSLDIAGGSRISGDAPDFISTAGLTWAFGFAKMG